jgi:hypothetical protein
MSEDGIENLYMAGHRRPRQEDALQLGPRKNRSSSLAIVDFVHISLANTVVVPLIL